MKEVMLTVPGDFGEWRDAARALLAAAVPPDAVSWRRAGEAASLFGDGGAPARTVAAKPAPMTLPRRLVERAGRVICHRDTEVPARLYRLVWRAASDRQLLDRHTDPDVDWLAQADKSIRRDVHKMHAFVRFRRLGEDANGRERFAAWFEPDHHIVRIAAPFFQRRFFGMDWAIVTPDARAVWQGEALAFGPGGVRTDVPDSDVVEDQWRTYYGAIFNPARVKIAAMRAEMPKKYWRNLPEAQDIAPLLAGAAGRVEHMRATAVSAANPRTRKWLARSQPAADGESEVETLADLANDLGHCTRCPLHCNATQAVAGEGPTAARMMLVGEQPGDREDLEGRPFVGPAGQILNAALEDSGLQRSRLYLTNAVKHFKFEPRGKRRLHQNPARGEIDLCRWWLDKERQLVRPSVIVTLGASALRGVMGSSHAIGSIRGKTIELDDGVRLVATIHPSFLLRLPDRARAAEERAAFVADLARARDLAAM